MGAVSLSAHTIRRGKMLKCTVNNLWAVGGETGVFDNPSEAPEAPCELLAAQVLQTSAGHGWPGGGQALYGASSPNHL